MHFDEEPKTTAYEEVTLRVAAGRHLRIFGKATLLPPEGIVGGISWIIDAIIQPWQGRRTSGGMPVYGASIYDNPYLLPDEVAHGGAAAAGAADGRGRVLTAWQHVVVAGVVLVL